MRKHVTTLATFAVAFSTLMVSCALPMAGAKEQTSMSATLKEHPIPFHDPALLPLVQAIASGDAARIRQLAATAYLGARGDDNLTVLEWAIWNEKPQSLAALLEAGADASALGMDQETVAHMAAMAQDPKYLQVLIDHQAPVDIVSPRAGWTPIFRAVQSRRETNVDLLIKAGADLTRTDSMGNSLLHVAANVHDSAGALKLLQAGADPQTTNARGQTFQAALFSGSDARLNAEGRAARQQVRDWLANKGIATQ